MFVKWTVTYLTIHIVRCGGKRDSGGGISFCQIKFRTSGLLDLSMFCWSRLQLLRSHCARGLHHPKQSYRRCIGPGLLTGVHNKHPKKP